MKIHDHLRASNHKYPKFSNKIMSSQTVKTSTIVNQKFDYDNNKQIKRRKRFTLTDTLGLSLETSELQNEGKQWATGNG